MKNTLATATLLVLLTFVFSQKVMAWVPARIKVIPTATPIIFKKVDPNINLQLIPTIVSTAGAKLTVIPTPTLGTKLTVTPSQGVAQISPSVAPTVTPENKENGNISKWFMGISMGLLALIIIIQLFPKKKADQ